MDQLVLEAISVSLVLCVASMSKGARKTTSPTHGSNYDARTSLPDDDEKRTPTTVQI